MELYLVTPPAAEPVTLDEAKSQVRVDHAAEDELLTRLAKASREYVEEITGRQLVTATWEARFDAFPDAACAIRLPKAPLLVVDSVKYIDTAGVLQTLASSEYEVDAPAGPSAAWGRIWLGYGKTWPATRPVPNAVRVQIQAGYGAAADAVPDAFKQAILLRVGDLYTRRASGLSGTIFADTGAFRALLAPYRLLSFA